MNQLMDFVYRNMPNSNFKRTHLWKNTIQLQRFEITLRYPRLTCT